MRCRVGDVAVIIKAANSVNIGRLVTVVEPYKAPRSPKPAWIVDGVGPGTWSFDENLRPIRNSGEDARDETLEWLPVPSKEKETA